MTLYPFGYEDYASRSSPISSDSLSRGWPQGCRKASSADASDFDERRGLSERPAPCRTGPATTTEPSMGITTSQAERLAGKEADRRRRQKKKLEDKIESIEKEIEELKEELCKPEYASMYSKLTEIQNEIDAKEEELLTIMEEWDNS